MLTRRTWLKTGVAGAALLGTAWWLRQPLDRWGRSALAQAAPLDAAMAEVLPALLPLVLAGALPQEPGARQAALARGLDGVRSAVAALSAPAQREVAELFALLTLAPTRIALAGLRRPWAQASEAELQAFLEGWRHSSIGLLRSAYQALHDLMLGAWYADASQWGAIGYPGPPEIARP